MSAELALNDIDSDQTSERIFSKTEGLSALVTQAAQGLINYATPKTPVELFSWGSPENVFEEIADTLTPLHGRALAEEMAIELVKDAEEHASEFRAAHNTKTIGVMLVVSNTVPEGQFETGAKQAHKYDIENQSVEIVGASVIERQITASGSKTTSNRADIDAMSMSGVQRKTLWAVFEAPDKEELQGIAQDATVSALASMTEGSLTPEEASELLAELQKLTDLDLLSPELSQIIENLQMIATLSEGGVVLGSELSLEGMVSETVELLEQAIKDGAIESSLAGDILNTIKQIGEMNNVAEIVPSAILSSVEVVIETQAVKEQIQALIEAGDFDAQTLSALIEGIHELEGQDLMDRLDGIKGEVSALDLPIDIQGMGHELIQSINGLNDKVSDIVAASQQAENSLDATAAEVIALLQSLDGIDFDSLSAEQKQALETVQGALETLDVENLTVDDVKAILKNDAEPALLDAMQTVLMSVNSENVQLALPQENLNIVSQFLIAEEAFVSDVAQHVAIQGLTDSLVGMDAQSPEYQQIKDVLQRLEAGESITDIDPALLTQVLDKMGDQSPPSLVEVAAVAVAMQSDPVILSSETLEIVQSVSGDLSTIVAELEALQDSGDITPEQARLLEKVESIIEKLDADPANIVALAELSQISGGDFDQVLEGLPPSVMETIDALQDNVDSVVEIQKEALAIHHEISTDNVEAIVSVVNNLGVNSDILIEAGITNIDQMMIDIAADPTSIEAAVAIETLLQNPDIPETVREQLVAQLDSIQDVQVSAISAEYNIEPAQATALIEAVVAVETLSPEIKQELSEAGVDLTSIIETITDNPASIEAATEVAKLEQILADPTTSVQVREAIQEKLGDIVADVKDVQIAAISAEHNIEPAQAVALIEAASVIEAVSPDVRSVLSDAGVDISSMIDVIADNPSSLETVKELVLKLKDGGSIDPSDIAAIAPVISALPASAVTKLTQAMNAPQNAGVQKTADVTNISDHRKEVDNAQPQANQKPSAVEQFAKEKQVTPRENKGGDKPTHSSADKVAVAAVAATALNATDGSGDGQTSAQNKDSGPNQTPQADPQTTIVEPRNDNQQAEEKPITGKNCGDNCDCDTAFNKAVLAEKIHAEYTPEEIKIHGGEEALINKTREAIREVDKSIVKSIGIKESIEAVEAENRAIQVREALSQPELAKLEKSENKVGGDTQDTILAQRIRELEAVAADIKKRSDGGEGGPTKEFNESGCAIHGKGCDGNHDHSSGHNHEDVSQRQEEMSFDSLSGSEKSEVTEKPAFTGKTRARRSRAPKAA